MQRPFQRERGEPHLQDLVIGRVGIIMRLKVSSSMSLDKVLLNVVGIDLFKGCDGGGGFEVELSWCGGYLSRSLIV